MTNDSKIFVAGHKGMVGSAILRILGVNGYYNVSTISKNQLDLNDSIGVAKLFAKVKPDYVIVAAAKVGGIGVNEKYPVEFLKDNLIIQNNIIEQSYLHGVKKIIFLGSSCIYPKDSPQPMKEEYLLKGPLEPTNEGYALAKIVGIKLCQYYSYQYGISSLNIIPCNLYGTNDHFDVETGHVLATLIKRFIDAKEKNSDEIVLWGSGVARREFMHVDDLARAVLFLIEKWSTPEIINVGTGRDISIFELANKIASITGYEGNIKWDDTKPDGMLKKCLDISKLRSLGFNSNIDLDTGIKLTVKEYYKKKNG